MLIACKLNSNVYFQRGKLYDFDTLTNNISCDAKDTTFVFDC